MTDFMPCRHCSGTGLVPVEELARADEHEDGERLRRERDAAVSEANLAITLKAAESRRRKVEEAVSWTRERRPEADAAG